jgi:hypothetical protein
VRQIACPFHPSKAKQLKKLPIQFFGQHYIYLDTDRQHLPDDSLPEIFFEIIINWIAPHG